MIAISGAVILGALLGWALVPRVSDWLLRRARCRSDAWWSDSLGMYRAFKQEYPHREPRASASGVEGALGLWRDEALANALAGTLTDERIAVLSGLGVEVAGLASVGSDKKRRERCSFKPSFWQRVLMAVVMAGLTSVAVVLSPGVFTACSLVLCIFAMAVSVVCDVRARIIPLEACATLALVGAAFQFAVRGLEGVLAGLLFALVVLAGISVVNRMLRSRCAGEAVGRGDLRCMGSLALATGAGAVCGFAACYVFAALGVLVGCAARRLSWGDGIPMAPFLAIWLACGTAVTLMSP